MKQRAPFRHWKFDTRHSFLVSKGTKMRYLTPTEALELQVHVANVKEQREQGRDPNRAPIRLRVRQ